MKRFLSLSVCTLALFAFAPGAPALATIDWNVGWGTPQAQPDGAYAPSAPDESAPQADGEVPTAYGSIPAASPEAYAPAESGTYAAPAPTSAEEDALPDTTEEPLRPGQVEVVAETPEMQGEGRVERSVTVRVTEGEDPVANERVLLHVMRMPHDLLATYMARTNTQGEAIFDLRVPPDTEAFAQVTRERSFFSRQPVTLDQEGAQTTRVVLPGLSRDPSVVRVIRLDTIAEPWEKFVAFTQVWNFTTEDGSVFQPAEGEPIVLPLPEGAQGVSLLLGEEHAEVLPDRILWTGRIEPATPGSEITPQLVFRFSMRLPERARRLTPANHLTFRQTMSLQTEGATFVVPRTTTFRKHPVIDTEMQARFCDQEGSSACFRRQVDEAPPGLLREGTPATALVGGRVEAGGVLEVSTTGWPAPPRSERRWALLFGLLALAAGGLVFTTQVKRFGRARDIDQEREILEDRRRDLIAQAEALADAWERGELRTADMEREKERIREHLGVVLRRMRQREPAAPHLQADG